MTRYLFFVVSMFLSMMSVASAFDLQGHRGARGLMPENTLPAFVKALSIGVTTLELDVGITKDGVVVVSHNPVLDEDLVRDAGGKWLSREPLIHDLTFAELQAFDVGRLRPGSQSSNRFPDQTPVDGTKMPSLVEVFDLVKKSGNGAVRFNIETKINPHKPEETADPETFAAAVLNAVRIYDLQSRVSIQSFDWRTLQVVQILNPEIETVYLTAQQEWMNNVRGGHRKPSKWTAGYYMINHGDTVPKLVKKAGGKVWSPFHRDLNRSKIEQAHALGLKVIPWTINDEKTMEDMIAMGVDGIISDYPDRLRIVMEKSGLPLPRPTLIQP